MPNGDSQVEVYSPQGEYGTIPSAQVMPALAQGYKAKSSYVEAVHPQTGQTGIIPKEQWPAAQAQGFTMSPTEQAQQQMISQGKSLMQPSWWGGAHGTTEQEATIQKLLPQVPGRVADIRKGALEIGGSMLGAGAVAEGGAGLLPAVLRSFGSGGGAAIGNVTGAAISGQKPSASEALKSGGLFTAGTLLGEGIEGIRAYGLKQIAKLSGETPERIAELRALPPTEQAIASRINQAEETSRAAFKDAYPPIAAAPVNLGSTRAIAKQAAEKIVANPVPGVLEQVRDIPLPTEAQAARQIAPEIWHPNEILDRLMQFHNIPFRDAQLYRTAIERFISRAGGKLPSEVYAQLKAVSGSLGDGLRATAKQEGVLQQFLKAEGMFKQHAADFWNKGAPLKDYLPLQKGGKIVPGQDGTLLNRFIQVANQGRALQALERLGVPTQDLRAILAKGADTVRADISDAATLKNLGQGVIDQRAAAAVREALKRNVAIPAVKAGAGAVGAGAAAGAGYALYKGLKGK